PFLSFRLLVPMLPPVMLVIAVAAARLRLGWRRAMLGTFLLIGVAGTASVLSAGSADRSRLEREARAIGAAVMGHLLYYKHPRDLRVIAERIDALPAELRGRAYQGLGFSLAYHHDEARPASDFVSDVAAVPEQYRENVVRGARLALGPGM